MMNRYGDSIGCGDPLLHVVNHLPRSGLGSVLNFAPKRDLIRWAGKALEFCLCDVTIVQLTVRAAVVNATHNPFTNIMNLILWLTDLSMFMQIIINYDSEPPLNISIIVIISFTQNREVSLHVFYYRPCTHVSNPCIKVNSPSIEDSRARHSTEFEKEYLHVCVYMNYEINSLAHETI